MTSCNACSLQVLAAEAYLNAISKSHVLRCMHSISNMIVPNEDASADLQKQLEDTVMQLAVSTTTDLSNKMDAQMQYLQSQFANANAGVMRVVRRCVQSRANREESVAADLMLQLFFLSSITLQSEHEKYLFLLDILEKQFPSIKKLLTGFYGIEHSSIKTCIKLFPKLVVVRALITMDLSSMRCFRKHLCDVQELYLGDEYNECTLTENDFSRVFFNGHNLSDVHDMYCKTVTAPLSFKKLKILSLPLLTHKHRGFISQFLHHYPNTDLRWKPECEKQSVSIFEGAIFYNIDMNTDHKLRHCELCFDDLRLNYVDEILIKWSHLEALTLIITPKVNLNCIEKAKKKLLNIFSGCSKLTRFRIILNNLAVDKYYQIVVNCLETNGYKLQSLTITDNSNFISHKDLIRLVNFCPNLKFLHIKGCPVSRLCKEEKLKPLNNLLDFKCVVLDCVTSSKIQVTAKFVCDVIKAAPNLVNLTTYFEDFLFNELLKTKFLASLKSWSVYMYAVTDTLSLMRNIKTIIKKMCLAQLAVTVMAGSMFEASCIMQTHAEMPQVQMRNLLKNCQVNVKNTDLDFDSVFYDGITALDP